MRYGIWMLACLLSSGGCTVRGFSNLPDGATTSSQLRSAAAVARAEADALDEIADQRQDVIDRTIATVQGVADQIGAPAVLTGLLGAGAGFFVPTPGQRRRERVAAAEAKTSGTTGGDRPA